MDIKTAVQNEIKNAMKAHDADTVSALRLLVSEIKKREIDTRSTLSDTDVQKVVQSLIKQRNDSIEAFSKGGRTDLADKERKEAEILKRYLPKQLDPAAIELLVAACIRESGATRMEEMGKVMKLAISKAAGQADGRTLHEAVRTQLSKVTS